MEKLKALSPEQAANVLSLLVGSLSVEQLANILITLECTIALRKADRELVMSLVKKQKQMDGSKKSLARQNRLLKYMAHTAQAKQWMFANGKGGVKRFQWWSKWSLMALNKWKAEVASNNALKVK